MPELERMSKTLAQDVNDRRRLRNTDTRSSDEIMICVSAASAQRWQDARSSSETSIPVPGHGRHGESFLVGRRARQPSGNNAAVLLTDMDFDGTSPWETVASLVCVQAISSRVGMGAGYTRLRLRLHSVACWTCTTTPATLSGRTFPQKFVLP